MAESHFATINLPISSIVQSVGNVLFQDQKRIVTCRISKRKPTQARSAPSLSPSQSAPTSTSLSKPTSSEPADEVEYEFVLPRSPLKGGECIADTLWEMTVFKTGRLPDYWEYYKHFERTQTNRRGKTSVVDEWDLMKSFDQPFMLQIRETDSQNGRELIWWFITQIMEVLDNADIWSISENEALERLTDDADKEVVKMALKTLRKAHREIYGSKNKRESKSDGKTMSESESK